MKRKIVIRPISVLNAQIELKFEFQDTIINKYVFIPNDYTMIATDRQYTKGKIALKAVFKEANDVFTYEWDTTDGIKNDIGLSMMRHPLVKCQGNDNLKNPFFECIDVSQKAVGDALSIKKKGLVFNLINNTTIGKMRDIGFCYGYNSVGKTYTDIFIDLVDFSRGILMTDVDKSIKLLEGDMDQTYVVMKKAIALNIISKRDGIYYVKTDVAGDTEDKVLLYLKENKGMYENFVRKEVAQRDNLEAQDYELMVKDNVLKEQEIEIKAYRRRTMDEELEMKELKEEAKALKIKGAHLIASKDRLEAVIQKAKEQIAAGKEPEEIKE
jgi:hypothetical protein